MRHVDGAAPPTGCTTKAVRARVFAVMVVALRLQKEEYGENVAVREGVGLEFKGRGA